MAIGRFLVVRSALTASRNFLFGVFVFSFFFGDPRYKNNK